MTDQYKRVPVEPTQEEIDAGINELCATDLLQESYASVIKRIRAAMLAAAPPEDELARLEREIAENWAGMYINGAHECYYADGWLDIDRYCHKGVARDFMRKAARYLELRGLLEHHPTEPKLVRIRQEEGDE